jgi:hypothetical protein
LELRTDGITVHTLAGGQITVAVGVVNIAAGIAAASERITDTGTGIFRAATAHGTGADALARAVARRGLGAGVGVVTSCPCDLECTTIRATPAAAAIIALLTGIDDAIATCRRCGINTRAGVDVAGRRRGAGQRLIAATIAASVTNIELGTLVAVVARGGGSFKGTRGGTTVRATRRAGAATNTSADRGIGGTVREAIFALFAVVALLADAGIGDTVTATDGLRRGIRRGLDEAQATQ